jgi:signal transduction histidine kinase
MVEELLDFSRLESGSFALNIENSDIHELLLDVVELIKPRAIQQDIVVKFDCPQSHRYLKVDKYRMKQVFINILDNAIKYTPPGGKIEISTGKGSAANPGFYEIKFSDTGCGIGQDELDQVKKRFFRGKASGSKKGIGLGLPICDQLVGAHGGTLDILSEIGKGTTVVIKLPIQA